MLPQQGHVLGIDIGFSPKNRSSAVCRLSWDSGRFSWAIQRFRYDKQARADAITQVAGGNRLLAAALDGPIRGSLDEIGRYRAAEQILTRKLQPYIGKPGQSSAPVGKRLNNATNKAAQCLLNMCHLEDSMHDERIHQKAIVEAFPTSFMGLMLEEAKILHGTRSRKSDRFYVALAERGLLEKLLNHLHPGATFVREVSSLTNHDDRAALICALTALCIAAGKYFAVGDADGWIILPPKELISRRYLDLINANIREISAA